MPLILLIVAILLTPKLHSLWPTRLLHELVGEYLYGRQYYLDVRLGILR